MSTLISTIVVLFIMAFLLFIGSLIRRYVEGLFEYSSKSVSPSYIERKYGPLETRTHWRWNGNRVVKTVISKRKGL